MKTPRISHLRIRGLRTLEDVSLELNGLRILIGDNGTGKSSILEALEILRRFSDPEFSQNLSAIHGGLLQLVTQGSNQLTLEIEIATGSGPLSYSVTMGKQGLYQVIERELLVRGPLQFLGSPGGDSHVILREGARRQVRHRESAGQLAPIDGCPLDKLLLTYFGEFTPDDAFVPVLEALRGIQVQVGFEVLPAWVSRGTQRRSALREPSFLQPAERLERLGANLTNVFHHLKNTSRAGWEETMELVRLGLGEEVDDVNLKSDPGGGANALSLKYRGMDLDIPASLLSDGQLAYLAFVALYRLSGNASLIAFDEPEDHLHPALLMRVMGFFESMARQIPVVLATHSDRLLDGLSDPAESVVVCTLDARRRTSLKKLNREALDRWLTDYRGLGDLRAAGNEPFVLE